MQNNAINGEKNMSKDLVDAIITGNALDIENAFNSAIAEKISISVDAMREDIARRMFNQVQSTEE